MRTAPIVCPEENPLVRPQAHISCRGGLTRRLRRGRWGCRPEGGSTFFRSERKYQRKPAARRLREKALYCPFLKEGVRNVARNGVGQLSPALEARSCSLFSSFKKGKAFSLRCLSPLCSPAGGAGQTQPMRIGMFWRGLGGFAAQNSRLGFCSTVGINNHAQTTQLDALMQLGFFRNTKGQRDFISILAFIASHEARRRMAVFSIQLARSHTRPASRGTCRATAVKSRPSLMSFECSRAPWARCGVQGVTPCGGRP